MKGIRPIFVLSAAFCALVLLVSWWAAGAYADRRTQVLLRQARTTFAQGTEDALDAVLWYVGSYAAWRLNHSPAPRSVREMALLAEELYLDEINVVSTNGRIVASNDGGLIGYDFRSKPVTAGYMSLFEPDNRLHRFTQSFRPCAVRGDNCYCKYAGVAFTNRLGFVQVGYAMGRLVESLALSDAQAFRAWRFGRCGSFGAVDLDGDGIPDPVSPEAESAWGEGVVEVVRTADGVSQRLVFPFAGRLFYAEVPENEFGEQRNAGFVITASVLGLLVLLFSSLLFRLQRSSTRLEEMHRAAEERSVADLRLAHTIQMSSLPRAAVFNPEGLAYAFDALMLPAREVGGDFYDFFILADGRIAFTLGDVSGKGVPSAMFMLVAKNAVRQALLAQGDPAVAMAGVNAALCARNDAQMFVTMFVGVLDPLTGDMTYVNAGHNRPYVLRAGGSVERLELRGGRLLGLFADLAYRAGTLRLAPGDRLFLYTDGVTEAMDGRSRLYGEPRLRTLLASRPADLCTAVREDVAQHVGGAVASDDLTILTLDWYGEPSQAERTFPAVDASLRPALDFLRATAVLPDRVRFTRLLQAVDELVSNVVFHSGASAFTLQVQNGHGRCRVVLSDDGRAYNPLMRRDAHVPTEGGRGVLLAKRFSDFISWRREDRFNRLTIVQGVRAASRPE